MNKLTVASVSLLLCLAAQTLTRASELSTVPDKPAIVFKEAYATPVNTYGLGIHGELSVSKTSLFQDESFPVDIRIYSEDSQRSFFNVYWNSLLPLPGAMALYDAKKRYCGNINHHLVFNPQGDSPNQQLYFEEWGGSRRSAEPDDWTPIADHGYAGTKRTYRMPNVPPGTYYLQVIFFDNLLAPVQQDDKNEKLLASTSEIFRSNVVKIEVKAKPAGAKP